MVNKGGGNKAVNKKSNVSKVVVSKQVSKETRILEPVRKVWCSAKPLFLGVGANYKGYPKWVRKTTVRSLVRTQSAISGCVLSGLAWCRLVRNDATKCDSPAATAVQ
ncbi:hypothetical protein GCM10027395_24010 [Giesbergeria sinuosa]